MSPPNSLKVLILLSFATLGLAIAMFFAVYYVDKRSNEDSVFINHAGLIRGSIQRIPNLVAVGRMEEARHVRQFVDQRLQKFVDIGRAQGDEDYARFDQKLQELSACWSAMYASLRAYDKDREQVIFKIILQQAEQCWSVSDELVSEAQSATEAKLNKLKFFLIFLFVLNVLTALIIVASIYFYVVRKLGWEVEHDTLTSLFNLRAFESRATSELLRIQRYGGECSLIYLDIDYFKRINDTYGHHMGDSALRQLSDVLRASIRSTDAAFRLGGEEFAVICTHTGISGALKVAEELRKKVQGSVVVEGVTLTISLGVATFSASKSLKETCSEADQALYEAKQAGRNRTCIYQGDARSGEKLETSMAHR